jgi:hypothetical protein
MSDYLDHLTAKALNLMEGIQPRLASLFEPPSAAGRPMAARRSAEGESVPDEPFPGAPSFEALLSTQESFSHAGQSRPPTIGLRRPAAILPQQPTVIADNSMNQRPGLQLDREPSPLLTPQAVDTASGQLRSQPGPNPARTTSTATPAASSSPGAAGPLDAKAVQPSHPDTPILAPVTTGQESAGAPSTHTGERQSLSALEQIIGRAVAKRAVLFDVPQSENVTHPRSVSDQAVRSSTPAMSVVQPHVTLYREPPVSIPSTGTAMPEPAPTIKITIGRVDVRAVTPAMPAARPAPARPSQVLSLEDYLKQREGGRR